MPPSDDEFDSGDDLFADVDADTLISPPAGHPSNKRALSPDDFSGSDVFDDLDVDKILGSSQQQAPTSPENAKRVKLNPDEENRNVELARQLLREKFGYNGFRHEQEKAIQCILRGENALVIFPTGAGKSLCYQIPAIAFEVIDKERGNVRQYGSGLTIVVSPLLALMKDQTDALKKKGIHADCSDSTKTYEQHKQIMSEIQSGKLRLLYVAPEKLNNEGFVASMRNVPGGVRLVAIDEAHCISEWGHSFRPDYLKVARFVDEVKAERVICLTATATPRVADDVREAFQIQTSNIFRTSPYRPNLYLEATITKTKTEKLPKLFDFLRKHPGPTIVYVTLQKQSEEVVLALRDHGFDAAFYHAGMSVPDKIAVQDRFVASKLRIVVATIAFGMGIDVSNIRNIVHFDLSSTIEEYSQQIGRAGRDGLPGNCMLYLCNEDFYLRENFARGDLPSRKSLSGLLKDIFGRERTQEHDGEILKLSHYSLTSDYDIRSSPLSIVFATLELRYGILRAITPEYNKYQFEDKGRYLGVASNDTTPQGRAIFASSTRAKKYYDFDIKSALATTGLFRADLVRKLNSWHDDGIIELKASGVEHRYRILDHDQLPTSDEETDELANEIYADMEIREQDAIDKTQQVADMLTGDKCFALALAEHFGMTLPDDKAECGHCTHCSTKKPLTLPPKPIVQVDFDGIKNVLAACKDVRDDPRLLARVAFGIKSPRITKMKLDKTPAFMSLANHEFKSLLREFENACKASAYGPLDTTVHPESSGLSRSQSYNSTPPKGYKGTSGERRWTRTATGPSWSSTQFGSGSRYGSGSRQYGAGSKSYGSGNKSAGSGSRRSYGRTSRETEIIPTGIKSWRDYALSKRG